MSRLACEAESVAAGPSCRWQRPRAFLSPWGWLFHLGSRRSFGSARACEMTDLEPIVQALDAGPVAVSDIALPRPNEVHCRIAAPDASALAEFTCSRLGADLILMLAEDRRAAAGAFFAHYLFAHRSPHWLLHASARLDSDNPEIPSLAAIRYPASRFEREMHDLFGIRVSGHPDPRPLVKHAFWPAQEYPLRKDAHLGPFA